MGRRQLTSRESHRQALSKSERKADYRSLTKRNLLRKMANSLLTGAMSALQVNRQLRDYYL